MKADVSGACEFLTRHVAMVFETMLSLKIARSEKERPITGERITGTVGFAGEAIKGVLYLDMSARTANQIAAVMLGQPLSEIPADHEVNDVIGELSNMIAGGLKSWLNDSTAPCAISTPAIIRGTSYLIEAPPDAKCGRLGFEFEGGIVTVEVHMQFE